MRAKFMVSLLGSILLSCSNQLLEHEPRVEESQLNEVQSGDQEKAAEEASEFQANEPVSIGGGYLVCAYDRAEKSNIGCRLENESKQKIPIKNLRSDDIAALSTEGSQLAVNFQPASESSLWHWLSVSDLTGLVIAKVALSKRFILDNADGYVSEVLDSAAEDGVAPAPPAELPGVGPPPPGGQITKVAEDKVRAGDSFWYYGPVGQSCFETCTANGGFSEAVTLEWSKSVGFCRSVVMKVFGLAIQPAPGQQDSAEGLGCFTKEGQIPTVFSEASLAPVNADAKQAGVRRLCSCNL